MPKVIRGKNRAQGNAVPRRDNGRKWNISVRANNGTYINTTAWGPTKNIARKNAERKLRAAERKGTELNTGDDWI